MKDYKNNYMYFMIFVLFWPAYKASHLLFRNEPDVSIIPLLIPFFIFLLLGLFFLFLNRELKIKHPILIILCMVSVDLLIKTLVFFTKPDIPVWDIYFKIKYVPNYYHTALLSLFKIETPSYFIVLLKLFLIIGTIYLFYRIYEKINVYIDILLICLLAALICGFFDALIFGHTVDYLYMNGYIVFDLKDVYGDTFLCLSIAYLIDLEMQSRRLKKTVN